MWEAPGGLNTYVDESIPKKGKQHGHSLFTDLPMGDINITSAVDKPAESETGQAAASSFTDGNQETGGKFESRDPL